MTERWIQAVVVGPSKPGYLKIALGSGIAKKITDVPADRIPSHLRLPNSMFLAVMSDGALVRVEEFDQQLIDVQDRIRGVLNTQWDPIGAAHTSTTNTTATFAVSSNFSKVARPLSD